MPQVKARVRALEELLNERNKHLVKQRNAMERALVERRARKVADADVC
jgi:hypothetical protein